MSERVHGPYEHRSKWRIVGVRADGGRIRRSFETRAEAQAAVDEIRLRLGTRTLGSAVRDYLDHLQSRGRRESTLETARYRLTGLLRLSERDQPLSWLTAATASALYAQRVTEVRPDTHRGELALACAAAEWWAKQGWITGNAGDAWGGVEPVGTLAAGKDQLRIDEARRFRDAALADASPAGLACALTLLTGARASEVTDRVLRDVDDGGAVLWVTEAKTKAGVRQLYVPTELRDLLLAHVARRRAAAGVSLWGDDRDRHWLGYHVRRLCRVAGVPEVSPHALRGVFATAARLEGAVGEGVARALGQTSERVTKRHYYAPGTVDRVESSAAQRRLAGDTAPGPSTI